MTACTNASRMAPPLWQQVYDRAIANGSSSDEAQTLANQAVDAFGSEPCSCSDQIEQILDMLQEQMLFA